MEISGNYQSLSDNAFLATFVFFIGTRRGVLHTPVLHTPVLHTPLLYTPCTATSQGRMQYAPTKLPPQKKIFPCK